MPSFTFLFSKWILETVLLSKMYLTFKTKSYKKVIRFTEHTHTQTTEGKFAAFSKTKYYLKLIEREVYKYRNRFA